MESNNWQSLMTQWNQALLSSSLRSEIPEAALHKGWLGQPGAASGEITALERRLGKKLPPSYREFLQYSNGWANLTPSIERLWSTRDIDWFSARNQDWIDAYNQPDDENPVSEEEHLQHRGDSAWFRAQYLQTALEISDTGDSAILLLNPQVVTPEGEWEAWFFANWLPGAERYPSFREMMAALYQQFLDLEAYKAKEDRREKILTDKTNTAGNKITVLLEILREMMQMQEHVAQTQSDPVANKHFQAILEVLRDVERQLLALESLSPAEQRTQLHALMKKLEMQQRTAHTTANKGLNMFAELGKILTGSVTMDDLQTMLGRMTQLSGGEGYRIALQVLHRAKF